MHKQRKCHFVECEHLKVLTVKKKKQKRRKKIWQLPYDIVVPFHFLVFFITVIFIIQWGIGDIRTKGTTFENKKLWISILLLMEKTFILNEFFVLTFSCL